MQRQKMQICVHPVTDEDPTNAQEAKEAAWQYTSLGGFYGQVLWYAVTMLYLVRMTAQAVQTEPTCIISEQEDGEVMDSVDVIGDQRSTIAYDKETDRLYFTTKGGTSTSKTEIRRNL